MQQKTLCKLDRVLLHRRLSLNHGLLPHHRLSISRRGGAFSAVVPLLFPRMSHGRLVALDTGRRALDAQHSHAYGHMCTSPHCSASPFRVDTHPFSSHHSTTCIILHQNTMLRLPTTPRPIHYLPPQHTRQNMHNVSSIIPMHSVRRCTSITRLTNSA